MPAPIGTVFNNLALKAGIKADDEKLKSLLASPELVNIQVPDELITAMDNGLLTPEAAKNNHPDIKKKYFADAFDGMDQHIVNLLDNENFSAEDIAEIKGERSTTKKVELIKAKLVAAKSKATPADKEAINKQIADLNEGIRQAKQEKENTVKEYEGKIKGIKKDAILSALLGNYKTIYDELDPEIKTATLTAIINKNLQDKNASLDVDENGKLILVGKDGSNVFGSDHVQLTPQSLLDKSLAPILKQSSPAKSPNGVTQQQTVVPGSNGDTTSSDLVKSHNAKVLAEMQNNPVSIM